MDPRLLRIIAIGVPALLLTFFGITSRLKVEVQILDRTYLRENPAVLTELVSNSEYLIRGNLAASRYDELEEELIDLVHKFIADKAKKDSVFFDDTTIAQADSVIHRSIQAVKNQHQLALKKIGQARSDTLLNTQKNRRLQEVLALTGPQRTDLLREALALIRLGFDDLNRIDSQVLEFLENKVDKTPSQLRAFAKSVSHKTTSVTSPFRRMYDDPLASAVAYAPDEYWQKVINRTKARTHFGNADIAVVMESSGDYTIKGMRNDASQATRAALSMLNQTVTAVAKQYGVGFASGKGDTTQSFVRETYQAEYLLDGYRRSARASQLAILGAILSQTPNLNTATSYSTSAVAIRKVFNAQKTQLTKQP
jgi:hypothetical protein